MDEIELTNKEFNSLRKLIFENFGINLTDTKKRLVVGRLRNLINKYQLTSFGDYYQFVVQDKSGKALNELANKISTNFTYFYREPEHFNFMKKEALPFWNELLTKQSSLDLRIWSAGCASGEEPYTIVMMLMEFFGAQYDKWRAGVLATDISESALQFALKKTYPMDRLTKLPTDWITKYFSKSYGEEFEVKQQVVKEVLFKKLNFMNPFPFKKKFHIIFCRNVMIYFDADTRKQLVSKFITALEPGGYLFIGHSESIPRETQGIEYIKPAIYRRITN